MRDLVGEVVQLGHKYTYAHFEIFRTTSIEQCPTLDQITRCLSVHCSQLKYLLSVVSVLFVFNQSAQSQTYQEFPMASCKGWSGTIISKSQIGTKNASMMGTVTRENIKEYCERTFDNGDGADKSAVVTKCMRETIADNAGAKISATADCATGRLTFTDERGRTRAAQFPLPPDSDQSCASGMPPLIEQFAILCPRSGKPSATPQRQTQARLPFADGTYVTDPSLCRLSAAQINDRLGDATGSSVRQINGSRLTNGYELSCNVTNVAAQGYQVRFQARCESEGEATRINGVWTKIDDRSFRIGQRTYSACGRSIWPIN